MDNCKSQLGKLMAATFKEMYVDYSCTGLIQIKCKCFPKGPNGKDEMVDLLLDFADVKGSNVRNIQVTEFNSCGSEHIPFFRHHMLIFECSEYTKTGIEKWFNNKYKFKKFTYKDVDYEVLDMLWF